MSRRSQMFLSSVGKKQLMALTGLAFIAFLIVHLAGNLNIFLGPHALNTYGETLESLGAVILCAEVVLAGTLLLHAALGILVVVRNFQARGQSYEVKKEEGGRSIASRTMWITGPFILAFIVLHVLQFAVPYKLGHDVVLSDIVRERLADPVWAAVYGATMLIIALHVSHGFWSALQTLGLAPKRHGQTRESSYLLAIVFAMGYGFIAAAVYFIPHLLVLKP